MPEEAPPYDATSPRIEPFRVSLTYEADDELADVLERIQHRDFRAGAIASSEMATQTTTLTVAIDGRDAGAALDIAMALVGGALRTSLRIVGIDVERISDEE